MKTTNIAKKEETKKNVLVFLASAFTSFCITFGIGMMIFGIKNRGKF